MTIQTEYLPYEEIRSMGAAAHVDYIADLSTPNAAALNETLSRADDRAKSQFVFGTGAGGRPTAGRDGLRLTAGLRILASI